MTHSKVLKREEAQVEAAQTVCSLGVYAHAVFKRILDPDRERYCVTDLQFAKYLARRVAAALESIGPKSLWEPATASLGLSTPADDLAALDSMSASLEEWQDALEFVSRLVSILITLLGSVSKDDQRLPDIIATLGILGKLQTRIVGVLSLPRDRETGAF